jgi:hypothetical protein
VTKENEKPRHVVHEFMMAGGYGRRFDGNDCVRVTRLG